MSGSGGRVCVAHTKANLQKNILLPYMAVVKPHPLRTALVSRNILRDISTVLYSLVVKPRLLRAALLSIYGIKRHQYLPIGGAVVKPRPLRV